MRARNVLGSGARSRPMSRPTSVGFNRVHPRFSQQRREHGDSTKARAERTRPGLARTRRRRCRAVQSPREPATPPTPPPTAGPHPHRSPVPPRRADQPAQRGVLTTINRSSQRHQPANHTLTAVDLAPRRPRVGAATSLVVDLSGGAGGPEAPSRPTTETTRPGTDVHTGHTRSDSATIRARALIDLRWALRAPLARNQTGRALLQESARSAEPSTRSRRTPNPPTPQTRSSSSPTAPPPSDTRHRHRAATSTPARRDRTPHRPQSTTPRPHTTASTNGHQGTRSATPSGKLSPPDQPAPAPQPHQTPHTNYRAYGGA